MNESTRIRPLLLYLLILAVFVLHTIYLGCVAEDSHITFRYAKHLAEGYGIVWNKGETPPVEGYTNFLWLIITSVFIRLGIDVFAGSVIAGTLAAIGTIETSRRFALRFLGCSRITALVPALLLAVSGPMATWAGSGMETSLFGFMLMAAVYFFAGYWTSGSRFELSVSAAAILLATLLRPEGLMIFCLLAGISVVVSAGRMRDTLVDHVIPFLIYAVPFGIYFIWRLNYFGDPLPNTFYAKTGGGLPQYLRGAQYLVNFSGYYLLPLLVPLMLGFWETGLPRCQAGKSLTAWRIFAREHIGLLIIAAILPVYLAYILAVGGDYMAMYRFLVPLLPLIYLLLAPVLEALGPVLAEVRYKKNLALAGLGFTVLATAFHSTPLEEKVFQRPGRQHGHYRGVQTERWHVARLSEIGKFFNDYKQSSGDSLATRAIGAIGYYAEMNIDDLMGLTDPVIAHKKTTSAGHGWAGHEKLDPGYSFGRLPTYFIFDRNLQSELVGAPVSETGRIDIVAFIETNYPKGKRFTGWISKNIDFVQDHYKITSVWMVDEYNKEEGYFSFLELKDHAESRRVSPADS